MKRYLSAILPAFLCVILFGVAVFGVILPSTERQIMEKKREMIRELTNTVTNILGTYEKQVEAGTLSIDEAQRRALNRIRALRYGPDGKGYFWVNDLDEIVLMHPYRPELEGKSAKSLADRSGKNMFQEFVRTVRERGAGYVVYEWQWMDNPDRVEPKLSYVRGFKPWGWVVGTGVYLGDVRREMQVMTHDLTLIGLAVLLLISLMSGYLTWREVRAERKSAEADQNLREMMNKYRAVLESSPDPVIMYDSQGNANYVNPAFSSTFGWDSEEVLGKPINFVPEDEREKTMKGIQAVYARAGTKLSMETKRYTKAGSLLEVMISAAVYRDAGGDPLGMVVNLTDITNIKRAEEALRQSEEKFRSISANALDGIIMIDPKGRIIFWNQASTKIFGHSAAEVLGRELHTVVAPERYRQDYSRAFRDFASTGGGQAVGRMIEMEAMHKNGNEFPVELSVSALQMNNQWYAVGIVRDITQRKQAEEAVRNNEQRYRAIIQAVPNIIAISEMESGRFLEVNERFLEVTGYLPEEAIGHSPLELDLYADPGTHERLARAVYKGTGVVSAEVVYKDRHGRHINCLVAMRPFTYGGRLCLLSVVQDITALREAEREQAKLQAQLQRSQRLEAIGTLAGGVAHDFNNLLQAISGYTQLMMAMEGLPEKAGEYVRDIDGAAIRAADLVQRLLTFSRKVEPTFQAVDLNSQVTEAARMLERTIPKMIGIKLKLAKGLWPVMADPNQMGQVLMNLGANSRDAMPDGGELIIETCNMELFGDSEDLSPGEYVVLRVSDTGEGMNAETLKKIYNPFYSTKGVGKGTGLGLSMVYGIVQGHGGHISCNSAPGKGTTFEIFLPAARGAVPKAPEANARREVPGGNETLLVVDDEQALLRMAGELLGSRGYSVLTAASGEEAVDIYRQKGNDIDLVIMDLGMPGMGGRRACRELLTLDPQVKVIISSGYNSPTEFDAEKDAGAKGFIDKPYRLEDLLAMVRQVLDS